MDSNLCLPTPIPLSETQVTLKSPRTEDRGACGTSTGGWGPGSRKGNLTLAGWLRWNSFLSPWVEYAEPAVLPRTLVTNCLRNGKEAAQSHCPPQRQSATYRRESKTERYQQLRCWESLGRDPHLYLLGDRKCERKSRSHGWLSGQSAQGSNSHREFLSPQGGTGVGGWQSPGLRQGGWREVRRGWGNKAMNGQDA